MYTTEMIEEILTSESAQRMIQRVTNKYGASYVGLWLLQVMGMSNDDVKALIDDFKLQVVPQTATWSLSIWEESVGLSVDTSLSIEERRLRIIEKKRKRASMNPARIEQIISAIAGADVRMDEYFGKNRSAIYISSIPPLVDESRIRQKLKEIKQSHRIFSIYYEQAAVGNIYLGGTVQTFKEITLKEVK